MKWTNEKPKVAGPWWVRTKPGGVLAIEEAGDGLSRKCWFGVRLVDVTLAWGGMVVRDCQENVRLLIPISAEWAGPIEPPTEPGA